MSDKPTIAHAGKAPDEFNDAKQDRLAELAAKKPAPVLERSHAEEAEYLALQEEQVEAAAQRVAWVSARIEELRAMPSMSADQQRELENLLEEDQRNRQRSGLTPR